MKKKHIIYLVLFTLLCIVATYNYIKKSSIKKLSNTTISFQKQILKEQKNPNDYELNLLIKKAIHNLLREECNDWLLVNSINLLYKNKRWNDLRYIIEYSPNIKSKYLAANRLTGCPKSALSTLNNREVFFNVIKQNMKLKMKIILNYRLPVDANQCNCYGTRKPEDSYSRPFIYLHNSLRGEKNTGSGAANSDKLANPKEN